MTQRESTPPHKARAAVIIIMGPTAAGKSALAIELARAFRGEIVNADSRQVYVGMDIGTDKPTPQRPSDKLQAGSEPQRRTPSKSRDSSASPQNDTVALRDQPIFIERIPHYLLDILTPDQRYSAAEFRDDATRIIGDIHRRGKLPIVVGGTGFFIRVLAGDRTLPDVPPDPPFRAWAETQPVEALARELKKASPERYARVDDLRNKRRVVRALEIASGRGSRQEAARKALWATGLYGVGSGANEPKPTAHCPLPTAWKILKLALLPPEETLRQRIEARVDQQLRRGLVEEVRRLVAQYGADVQSLQAVGYRQVFPHLRGQATLAETRAAIIRSHWQYARRQWTWLKKEPRLAKASSPAEARRAVTAWLLGFSKKEETGGASRTLHPLAPHA